MKVYRIRNKESGVFFESTNGRHYWISKFNAEQVLRNYKHLKNYEEWRSQWEIVEYELKEVRVCN